MPWLKRAWRFLKRHWKWAVGGLAILLAMLAGIRYRKYFRKAQINEHKIKVLQAEREVARLEGKREMIRKQEGTVEADILAIDAEIVALNKKIEESGGEVKRMTSQEKLDEFKKLGY